MEETKSIRGFSLYQSSFSQLLWESSVLLFLALMIFLFGQKRMIISSLVALILIFRFVFLHQKGDGLFFLLGIILGGGNDLLSMWKGVYYYTPRSLLPLPIPLWMLFFWGEVFVFFRRLIRYPAFSLPEPGFKRILDLPLGLDLGFYFLFRLIIYRYAHQLWLPDALYAGLLLLRILILPPKDKERKLMLWIMVLGPGYEILLIRAGLYVYPNGVIFGVPLWLIVWWLFIIRFLSAIYERIEYFFASSKIPER